MKKDQEKSIRRRNFEEEEHQQKDSIRYKSKNNDHIKVDRYRNRREYHEYNQNTKTIAGKMSIKQDNSVNLDENDGFDELSNSSRILTTKENKNYELDWNNLKDVYCENESSDYNNYENEKKISNLINEFVKLNDHLTSECKLFEELESAFYFSSEEKIIDFINNDLKVCKNLLFTASRNKLNTCFRI